MTKPLTILGIPGSIRQQSYNKKLLRVAQQVAPEKMDIQIYDLIHLPMYNQDVERLGLPPAVADFHHQLRQADGLLFATPEYNYSLPGVLKNALDWASRRGDQDEPPINDKPAAIMGAAGRSGSIRAQLHLRQVLRHNNLFVLNGSVQVPVPWKMFDEERLIDDPTIERIKKLLVELEQWIHRLAA